jgi:hypothetical protein
MRFIIILFETNILIKKVLNFLSTLVITGTHYLLLPLFPLLPEEEPEPEPECPEPDDD